MQEEFEYRNNPFMERPKFEKRYLNTEEFESFFKNRAKEVNVRNPEWKKEVTQRIKYQLSRYLEHQRSLFNIIDFDIKVNRIGQSKIQVVLKYIEDCFNMKGEEFECIEVLKKPREVCWDILKAVEFAVIQKANRDSFNSGNKGSVCGVL